MRQVTDTGAIEEAVDAIIAANPDKVEQAKAKPTLLGWFVGQVMKATGGKANPQAVNELLKAQARDRVVLENDDPDQRRCNTGHRRSAPARDEDAQDLFGLLALCFAEYPGLLRRSARRSSGPARAGVAPSAAKGGAFWVVEDARGRVCGLRRGRFSATRHGRAAPPLRAPGPAPARRSAPGSSGLWRSTREGRGRRRCLFWSDTRFTDAHRLYERLGYRAASARRASSATSRARWRPVREDAVRPGSAVRLPRLASARLVLGTGARPASATGTGAA